MGILSIDTTKILNPIGSSFGIELTIEHDQTIFGTYYTTTISSKLAKLPSPVKVTEKLHTGIIASIVYY